MMEDFKEAWAARSEIKERLTGVFRLAVTLPKFFRERITVQEAAEEIKRALESREERLLERLRTALSDGSRANRFMAGVWQHAGALRIRREIPHASPRGKILPLHMPR